MLTWYCYVSVVYKIFSLNRCGMMTTTTTTTPRIRKKRKKGEKDTLGCRIQTPFLTYHVKQERKKTCKSPLFIELYIYECFGLGVRLRDWFLGTFLNFKKNKLFRGHVRSKCTKMGRWISPEMKKKSKAKKKQKPSGRTCHREISAFFMNPLRTIDKCKGAILRTILNALVV